jgi:hypothetical protein
LYDAFGQRQINTMYTQLNQYHVILEAQPQFQLDPNTSATFVYSGERLVGNLGAGSFHLFFSLRIFRRRIECDHHFGALHALFRRAHGACECAGAQQQFDWIELEFISRTPTPVRR